MKNLALSLNVKNNTNSVLVNGQYGSSDFQVGLNEDDEVCFSMNGVAITAKQLYLLQKNEYKRIKYIKDYAYEVWYDDIDYDYAFNYFKNDSIDAGFGGCSAVRCGDFLGRNFDWIYNNAAEFMLHTKSQYGYHATYCTIGEVSGLDNDFVKSKKYSQKYKLVPFMAVDGINDCGVVAECNVVPLDVIPTHTENDGSREEICQIMLVRYILDNFASAHEAVDYVKDHVSLFPLETLTKKGYQLHWLVADKTNTYIIEIVNNTIVVTDVSDDSENSEFAGKSYMTNFTLYGITLNDDGTVYTPETQTEEENAIVTNNINPHGSGLERYNLIVSSFDEANTKDGMGELMSKLKYSNAYNTENDPYWFSEFVGEYDGKNMTVATQVSEYYPYIELYSNAYLNRTRDPGKPHFGTWHSTHSIVYDIVQKKAYIIFQEDGQEIEIVAGFESEE